MEKPYAESCDQNKEPILSVIKPLLIDKQSVLEVGSGTGQHAVFFAQQIPHVTWQPSDKKHYMQGISMWLEESGLENIASPIELDVTQEHWPETQYDAIFSANTLHIMHWDHVRDFFFNIRTSLSEGGLLIIYGPFNYNYQYTSESNAHFDDWLKERDSKSGIRDFEEVNKLAKGQNLSLEGDFQMPANNRILCWRAV